MADFNLTQTDAQVQSILNDAQDAQGAGAQTTLTTDYIMLKGTNGRYHKILKNSFTEAVRNVLAGLLVNNDKGTTISQIAAIASGDFGSVTPANLASVLGGITKEITSVTETDLDNYKTGGVFFCNNDNSKQISNLPYVAGTNGLGFTLAVFNGSIYKFQILAANNRGDFYIRNMTGGNIWNGWQKINTTDVS